MDRKKAQPKTKKLWFSSQISSKNYFYILDFSPTAFWQHGKMWAIDRTDACAVDTLVTVTYVKGSSRVCAHSLAAQKKKRKNNLESHSWKTSENQRKSAFANFSFCHCLGMWKCPLGPESCLISSSSRRNSAAVYRRLINCGASSSFTWVSKKVCAYRLSLSIFSRLHVYKVILWWHRRSAMSARPQCFLFFFAFLLSHDAGGSHEPTRGGLTFPSRQGDLGVTSEVKY